MRLTSTLMPAAAALALGFVGVAYAEDAPGAKSDITIVGTETAPSGAGIEQNSEGQGATDEDNAAVPESDDGAALQEVPPAGDEAAGAQSGAEDPAAPGKSAEDLGAPPAKPDMQKEGKLPSPSSAY